MIGKSIKTTGTMLALSAISLLIGSNAYANPQNPTVVAGSATFTSPNPNTLNVKASDGTIISWKNFSIDAGQLTKFTQPSSAAAVLNRVSGVNPSAILGTLDSNGKLFLVNPNGVLIGNDAVINTASFVASTFDVLNSEFLAKGDMTFQGTSTAQVINLGSIDAWEGDVILMAYSVENQGILNAPKGIVAEGAGQEFVLMSSGDQRLMVVAQAPVFSTDTGIENGGVISAIQAELKADGNLFGMAINHAGIIDAQGVVSQNGRVFLVAEGGTTQVDGQIFAINDDGTGGTAQVLGDIVLLSSNAVVDVSGNYGGGMALIGGNVPDTLPVVYTASVTLVEQGASVTASALGEGDGGYVAVWGNGDCAFGGIVNALAGEIGGDGGMVNIGTQNTLEFSGFSDTTAQFGNLGTLNLSSISLDVQDNQQDYTPTNLIDTTLLVTNLGTNNVNLFAVAENPYPATLNVIDPVVWNSPSVLSLYCDNNINIYASIEYTAGNNLGMLNIDAFGNINVESIATSIDLSFQKTTLNMMAGGDIIITGGSVYNEGAIVLKGSLINMTAGNDLLVMGGTGSGASVTLDGTKSLSVDVGGIVFMQGGAGLDADVIIPQNASMTVHTH